MNYHRGLKREIRKAKRLSNINAGIAIALFTWFVLEISLERKFDIVNLYQIAVIAYASIVTAFCEAKVEKLEAQLLVK